MVRMVTGWVLIVLGVLPFTAFFTPASLPRGGRFWIFIIFIIAGAWLTIAGRNAEKQRRGERWRATRRRRRRIM